MTNIFRKLALGLLVGGSLVVVIAAVSLAVVAQERKINGLGDVAFVDDCELEALADLLGFTPTRSVSGGAKDCDAPEPLDVQEDVSTAALTLGGVSIASGGLLLFVIHRRPELLSERKLKNIFARFGERRDDLDVKIRALDKLRKDGLLSDSEFQAQKQKLLEGR